MGLRLGFSVAAHLIAEILLVDEVLAVGDAAFQKKCLDKMSDISGMGKTVLLVTHQLHTIRRLCPQTIWLDKGSVKAFGKTNETINSYENAILSQGEEADIAQADRSGFLRWGILADDQQLTHSLDQGQEITIQFDIALARRIENGKFRVVLQNQDGLVLWGNTISDLNLEKEHYLFRYQLPDLYLEPGSYYWLVYLFDQHGWLDKWAATPAMSVNTIALNYGSSEQFLGILNPPYEFSVKEVLVLQSD
jgi:ABC-type glutathione transport system ATPase component